MVTLKQSRKPSGRLSGSKPPWEEFGGQGASETANDGELTIRSSFNGLLDRLAQIDYWDAWMTGKRITKDAKKMGIEATIRMSAVSELTELTPEDMDIFCSAFGLIKIVEACDDPLLLASDVFNLLKVFERFVDQGIISGGK